MGSTLLVGLIACLLLSSCEVYKRVLGEKAEDNTYKVDSAISVAEIEPITSAHQYKPAAPIIWKQQSVKARLSFNIPQQSISGKSILTLSPHLQSRTIKINALGMRFLTEPKLTSADSNLKIEKVSYDSLVLKIHLNKPCISTDTVQLHLDYTARPGSLLERGLIASHGQKGLFFIDPDESDPSKPTQVWSQGETEYNASWIPCINHPNQKTSQELYITVDTPYTALSNGRLVYMLLNGDGTRTYYWKQEKKHAPYLTMIAIGKFAIIEYETENGLPLYYYVEPKYARYAEMTFGKTPEIIQFFSEKFGYQYPWDKYAQVAVRDFVSGAMENTSATTITHFIQKDSIGYNDYSYEDYVVHEIAHQWFGDLVTCESWANLVLNEGFATYSEYLWIEETQSEQKAYEKLMDIRADYMSEARYKVRPLLDYSYHNPDDLFDRHAYQKGALIIHSLRQELGDDLFFDGVRTYLEQNAYGTTDVYHLQHAFEEASGRDLTEFFQQWFLKANHPILQLKYHHVDSLKQLTIDLEQEQAGIGYTTYRLSIPIAISTATGLIYDTLLIDKSRQHFTLDIKEQPKYLVADISAYPAAELDINWADDEVLLMLKNERHYVKAIQYTLDNWSRVSQVVKQECYKRIMALPRQWPRTIDLPLINTLNDDSISYDLSPLLKSSDNYVVSKTLRYISEHNKGSRQLFLDHLKLPSYYIKSSAVEALEIFYDPAIEDELIKVSEMENLFLSRSIALVWTSKGTEKVNPYFQNIIREYPLMAQHYGEYLGRMKVDFIDLQLKFIEDGFRNGLIEQYQLFMVLNKLSATSETRHSVEDHLAVKELIDQLMVSLEKN